MVRLIHEVLMEGNCYSWLCRLMNTLSFSQLHRLKIQPGQGVPSGCCPPEPSIPMAPGVPRARHPGREHVLGAGAQGRSLRAGRRSRVSGSWCCRRARNSTHFGHPFPWMRHREDLVRAESKLQR